MSKWIKLFPEQAHTQYRIPLEICNNSANAFWGLRRWTKDNTFDIDGPWPFISLLPQPEELNLVAFHMYTLGPEALASNKFNPLQAEGGYLHLKKEEFVELANILDGYSSTLPSESSAYKKTLFELDKSELPRFKILPKPNQEEYFYQQVSSSLEPVSGQRFFTVIQFSLTHSEPSQIFFWIGRFASTKLEQVSFKPKDHSFPIIYLDHSGLRELSSLMKNLITEK